MVHRRHGDAFLTLIERAVLNVFGADEEAGFIVGCHVVFKLGGSTFGPKKMMGAEIATFHGHQNGCTVFASDDQDFSFIALLVSLLVRDNLQAALVAEAPVKVFLGCPDVGGTFHCAARGIG